jgi:ribulose-phosphate 3-epimerase
MKSGVKIAPSIAAGDHGNLSSEARKLDAWGADWIHVDIMDGSFAPNLTFGPGAVKAIRKASNLPLDCHLMLSNPEFLCERFLQAGGDIITVHAEAVDAGSLGRIEKKVKEYGAKLGVAFKPSTELSVLDLSPFDVSLVTVMSVNPGFSGQKFILETAPKIVRASERYGKNGRTEIEVDGGVEMQNAKFIAEKGATVLVAGNAVFGQPDPAVALRELKKLVNG